MSSQKPERVVYNKHAMHSKLSNSELEQYDRHLKIPAVGESGQLKLKNASVLIAGCGGLGSASALYLAAAGIGRICVVDSDQVELSNLQRQVIHSTESIGKPKVLSAEDRLSALNPNIKIESRQTYIDNENVGDVIKDSQIVIDATDNFDTRYVLNDACVKSGIPFIYGAIFQFSGQMSVFNIYNGPCFRCVFANPPSEEYKAANRGVGVIGALPGIIGSLQALEAIKYFTGLGEVMSGRMLLFDGLEMEFKQISIKKNYDCPVCS